MTSIILFESEYNKFGILMDLTISSKKQFVVLNIIKPGPDFSLTGVFVFLFCCMSYFSMMRCFEINNPGSSPFGWLNIPTFMKQINQNTLENNLLENSIIYPLMLTTTMAAYGLNQLTLIVPCFMTSFLSFQLMRVSFGLRTYDRNFIIDIPFKRKRFSLLIFFVAVVFYLYPCIHGLIIIDNSGRFFEDNFITNFSNMPGFVSALYMINLFWMLFAYFNNINGIGAFYSLCLAIINNFLVLIFFLMMFIGLKNHSFYNPSFSLLELTKLV